MSRTERARLRSASAEAEKNFNEAVAGEVPAAQGHFEALRLQAAQQTATALAVIDLADEIATLTETIRRGFKETS